MSADFAAARLNMLDSQVRPADVTDWALQDAIGAAPRESVVPAQKGFAAYADTEVEYAPGRWLLRPRDVSKLLQALRPEAGERALAIAAPYAALVLETMGLSVDRLDGEDLSAVPGADYDLIIVEGAVAVPIRMSTLPSLARLKMSLTSAADLKREMTSIIAPVLLKRS